MSQKTCGTGGEVVDRSVADRPVDDHARFDRPAARDLSSPANVLIRAWLACLLGITACGAGGEPVRVSGAAPQAAPTLTVEARPEASAPREPVEPRRGVDPALLADLELLCAALRRDYVDGTLTDYYRGLRPTSARGEALLREGEETPRPGRVLQAAAREAGIAAEDPAIPSCAALFAELDDLE